MHAVREQARISKLCQRPFLCGILGKMEDALAARLVQVLRNDADVNEQMLLGGGVQMEAVPARYHPMSTRTSTSGLRAACTAWASLTRL